MSEPYDFEYASTDDEATEDTHWCTFPEAPCDHQSHQAQAWLIEDMSVISPKRNRVFIGTEDEAEASAAETLGKDAWVSGPYDFTIAVKP